MVRMLNQLFVGFALFCLVQTGVSAKEAAQAEEETASTPYQLVESVTDEMLDAIVKFRDDFDNNPDPLMNRVNQLLDQLVDFNWIASNVMGPYRKVASDEQRQRFAEVFRRSLVETYSRGMLSYSDEEIVLIPPEHELGDARKVVVNQQIHGANAVYPLQYTMAKNRDGEWKILNVVINGINLGKTFRNQFVQAAQKNGGDIDKVIDGWTAEQV